MKTIHAVLATGLFLLTSLPSRADGIDVPAMPEPVPALGTSAGETLSLDLARAYELALKRNLDLQVGRYDVALAGTGIFAQTGVFDPTFSVDVNGDYAKSPSATQLEGALVAEGRNTRFGLGLAQLLPSGTQMSLDLTSRRAENNSQFYYLNPNWTSNLLFGLRQPLLRGFGTLVNRSGIVIARTTRDQSASALAQRVTTVLRDVEVAYWELVATREAVAVKEQSLALAERLLNETRQRVDVGTSAPIDLVQSEAGVASRRHELILARNAAANAEDALRASLGFDEAEEWTVALEATEPYQVEPVHAELAGAIAAALAKRPELEQMKLGLAVRELYVQLARNDVMPQLDLEGTYGYSGVGGKGEVEIPVLDDQGNPVLDENGDPVTVTVPITSGFDESMTQIRKLDYPQWRLGVTLTVPLGNHAAKATLAQRRFELDRARVQLDALEQQIIHQVRRAVRALDDGAATIEAAVASRELAQRNLEAEQTKFVNGLSTNYQVLEIQDALARAQLLELTARISYRKAITGYREATGTLLEVSNVRIVDPGQPTVPHDYWGDVEWLRFVDLEEMIGRYRKPAAAAETSAGDGS